MGIFKTPKEFRAAYMVPGKPRQPANPDRLRELMRGAMIRNTRAVVALKLPRRHAAPTARVDGDKGERQAYEDLASEARRLGAGGDTGLQRMTLRHLLGAGGIPRPPPLWRLSIAWLKNPYPRAPAWRALAKRWAVLGAGGKEVALIELLRRNPDHEKKLVFVHYREMLAHLAGLLTSAGIQFARFEGSLSGPEKDFAIAEFRDKAPVLLCTESGPEGRKIQFCNTLINFDLPWNPMAIEQRISAASIASASSARCSSSTSSRAAPWKSKCYSCSTKRSPCSSWWWAKWALFSAAWRRTVTSPNSCSTPGWRRRRAAARKRSMPSGAAGRGAAAP